MLLVDVGNTRIKWRLASGSQVQSLPLAQWQSLPGLWQQQSPDRILVSSVASGELLENLMHACAQLIGVKPERVAVEDNRLGLQLAYSEPQRLGVDRWLAMLAACAEAPDDDVLVVSAGTALTADYVSGQGAESGHRKHLGGLLVPGLQMAVDSLSQGTGKIGPLSEIIQQRTVPECWQAGDATLSCVANGLSALYQGYLAQITRPPQWPGKEFRVFLTGGDADLLARWLPASAEQRPQLVLGGLHLLSRSL